jgi:hypothetical protein
MAPRTALKCGLTATPKTLEVTSPISALVPIFQDNEVALVWRRGS